MAEATTKTLGDVIQETINQATPKLNLRERAAVRIVEKRRPGWLAEELLAHAVSEGCVPAGSSLSSDASGIDRDRLIELLLEVLPSLLQLLFLFF